MTETAEQPRVKRKPGRTPGPETVKCTVLLPPDLAEWAKAQPGGMSELMRRLIVQEKREQEGGAAA